MGRRNSLCFSLCSSIAVRTLRGMRISRKFLPRSLSPRRLCVGYSGAWVRLPIIGFVEICGRTKVAGSRVPFNFTEKRARAESFSGSGTISFLKFILFLIFQIVEKNITVGPPASRTANPGIEFVKSYEGKQALWSRASLLSENTEGSKEGRKGKKKTFFPLSRYRFPLILPIHP